MDGRTLLAVITSGVLLVSGGCLSDVAPGGTDSTTTAWPSIPVKSDCSASTSTNTTNSSKMETLNRLPSGPVHLRIENQDSMEHDIGVSVRRADGKSVFTGTIGLASGSEGCVPDAVPRPFDGPISYEVSVTVDGRAAASRTYSMGAGIVEVQVFVEGPEQVRFGRLIN